MVTQLPTRLHNAPKYKLCLENVQKFSYRVKLCRAPIFFYDGTNFFFLNQFNSFFENFIYVYYAFCLLSSLLPLLSPHPLLPTSAFPHSCLFVLFCDPMILTRTSSVAMGLEMSIGTWYAQLYGRHIQLKTNTAPSPGSILC